MRNRAGAGVFLMIHRHRDAHPGSLIWRLFSQPAQRSIKAALPQTRNLSDNALVTSA